MERADRSEFYERLRQESDREDLDKAYEIMVTARRAIEAGATTVDYVASGIVCQLVWSMFTRSSCDPEGEEFQVDGRRARLWGGSIESTSGATTANISVRTPFGPIELDASEEQEPVVEG